VREEEVGGGRREERGGRMNKRGRKEIGGRRGAV
jgi:hypothetical protein